MQRIAFPVFFIQEVYRREQYAEKSEDESGKKT